MKLTALAGITALAWSAASYAQTAIVDDPLHGFCYGASACADNGTVTPVTGSTNPLDFGFSISPGPQTGRQFLVDILVPNNEAVPLNYLVTATQAGVANNGSISGFASLVSATSWTSGNLYQYLGLSPLGNGAPKNPLDAWLPTTNGDDPGATGYFVYQVDLGANQLMANNNEGSGPLLQLTAALDPGTVITGFLNTGSSDVAKWISTAQSGGIYVGGGKTPPSVPEPGTLALLGAALALFAGRKLVGRRAVPMAH